MAGEVARRATTAGQEATRHRMIGNAIPSLVLITLAAVVAPLLAETSRRFLPVPEVVIQILLGIALGPFVLNLVHPNAIISALSDFGLTFLMFLAGTELDLAVIRQGHLGRTAGSWGTSVVIALGRGRGVARDRAGARLRGGGALPHHHRPRHAPADPPRFGRAPHGDRTLVLSVGAIGEFGPIVAVAVLLTNRDARVTFVLLVLFVAVAVVAALLATEVHPPRFIALMRRHLHSTAQLPVRICVLLVMLLVYLATKLSLDVLLGAFAAGVVVRLLIKGEDSAPIESKLEAIGFGFLIPIFFIESGVNFDLGRCPSAACPDPRAHVHGALPLDPGGPTWAFFRSVVTRTRRGRWPSSRRRGCRSSWSSRRSACRSTG